MDTLKTDRGFTFGTFTDQHGSICSIQESSLAHPACIWLGPSKANPMITVENARKIGVPVPKGQTSGWVEFPVPACVLMTTRAHLSQDDVKMLLPYLQHFAEHGTLLHTPEGAHEVPDHRAALVAVRDRILDPIHGGIDDTFWMSPTETVVDYINKVIGENQPDE